MGRRTIRHTGASILAAAGVATALAVGGGGVANAATSTTMTCGSANPLPWAPPFTWTVTAGSGESLPPNGDALVPSLLLSGGNELPAPPGGLIPSIGPNWYGTQVLVDWHNNTTGESGRSVSDQAAWLQKPGIPINRTFTGVGNVDFTVTVQTGGGWWFLNTQNAVCRGNIDIVPGR
jgi:hypothetical protein